jgi:hypothetical protein
MDGLARMMLLTAGDRINAQRLHDEEAFRAWHRQPDALPDPIEIRDRTSYATNRPRTFVSRLVARLVTA